MNNAGWAVKGDRVGDISPTSQVLCPALLALPTFSFTPQARLDIRMRVIKRYTKKRGRKRILYSECGGITLTHGVVWFI